MNKKSLYNQRWAKMGGGGDGIEAPWTKEALFFMEGVTEASDDENSFQEEASGQRDENDDLLEDMDLDDAVEAMSLGSGQSKK